MAWARAPGSSGGTSRPVTPSVPTTSGRAPPVVATTGGALPEVVGTDGETGLLVPPDDPGALAAAIARLLDDPALRARLGAAGRERVVSRFTWQVTAAGTADQYRKLLEDKEAGRC